MTSSEVRHVCQVFRRTAVRRNGFSLIELLVVIAILLVLTSLVFAVVGEVKRSARRVEKINQMKQIGLALELYRADNFDRYPTQGNRPGESWADMLNVYARNDNLFVNSAYSNDAAPPPILHTRGFALNACYSSVDYLSRHGETISVLEAGHLISEESDRFQFSATRLPCPDKSYVEYARRVRNKYWKPQTHYMADYDRGGSVYLWSDGHVKWMSLSSVEEFSDCTCVATEANKFFGVWKERK